MSLKKIYELKEETRKYLRKFEIYDRDLVNLYCRAAVERTNIVTKDSWIKIVDEVVNKPISRPILLSELQQIQKRRDHKHNIQR